MRFSVTWASPAARAAIVNASCADWENDADDLRYFVELSSGFECSRG
jgi:hypothetical protein